MRKIFKLYSFATVMVECASCHRRCNGSVEAVDRGVVFYQRQKITQPCVPLVFLIQDEASKGSIHLTKSKIRGLSAFHIIISLLF